MVESLVVDIAKLRERGGETLDFKEVVQIEGLRVGAALIDDDRVELELELESIVEGISVSGRLSASSSSPCRRCLESVAAPVDVDVLEVFELDHDVGESYPLGDDDTVDLEPLVRDAVLLALPQSVLCREDCAGPDPDRFPTATEADEESLSGAGERGAGERGGGDPRWAALDELDFD